MILNLNGVVRGNRVELEGDSGLPEGTAVTVQLEARQLSVEEKRKRVDEACGSWTDDSLDAIFEEIIANRHKSRPRDIDLDAPS